MGMRPRALAERLAKHTEYEPNTGCWLWSGHVDKDGYGVIRVQGKDCKAHRAALGLALPGGLSPIQMACHHCDTPACINPAHLYAGDARSNMLDMFARGRASRRGEANGRHVLSTETVAEIRAQLEAAIRPGRQRRERGTIRSLARRYGVNRSVIHKIDTGEIWAAAHA